MYWEQPMTREKLGDTAVLAKLAAVSGWSSEAGGAAIIKTFRFADFNSAFGFMVRAALVAEQLDHHPEWTNVYRTVDVRLTTHDAGGLTSLDFDLAAAMDRIAGASGLKP